MSQFNTTGGGLVDSAGRQVERKVVVSTNVVNPSAPGSSIGGQLTNVAITEEPGGIRRGVFEYTVTGPESLSYSGFFQSGKRVELTGGTREVPIQTHKKFENMTEQEFAEVQEAVEAGTSAVLTGFSADQELLYSFLSRGVEYVLAPAVVGRITEIETTLPSLNPIAKVADPPELDALNGTFWICTAITATPVGNQYEVTREFTLNFGSWADVETLYGWS